MTKLGNYVFGVDVGGTTVKLGFFSKDGELLKKWEIPTRTDENGSNILPDIADAVKREIVARNMSAEEVIGVGIGVPGPVDDAGIVHKAANLGWDRFDLVETMAPLLRGLKIKGGNDANVAALGEMWKGGGEGKKNLVAVTLGTGVGGGIIVDGRLVNGATGAGGEIGHIHIQDGEKDTCGCGNHGCLEQYASATGVVRLAKRELEASSDPSVLRDEEISAKAVFDAVKAGDELAIRVAKQFGEYLGKGLAAIANVVNPEIIVIGGGVSKAGEVLFDYIKPPFLEYAFHGARGTEFALAKLGNDAGIYGSAKLILGE